MNWRLCKKRSHPAAEGQEGAVLVLMIFVIVAVLALAGVAIDAGNLYRARLRLQKAADAGALGGIGVTIHQGEVLRDMDDTEVADFVVSRARQLAYENLLQDNILVDPLRDIFANYFPAGLTESGEELFRLEVRIQADIRYLLIDLVPFEILGVGGVGSSTTVNSAAAQATAERAVANISLVLDVSNSMACPSEGACNCLTPSRTVSCEEEARAAGVPTKLDLLKRAVGTFLDQFDEGIDRISLVPFNIAASLDNDYANNGKAVHFNPPDVEGEQVHHGFTRDTFERAMGNFVATSNTNVCDGLMRAYQEAKRVQLVSPRTPMANHEMSYVYFSDGAPTAGRFLFAEPSQLPAHSQSQIAMGTHDYMSYSVQWLDQSKPKNEDESHSSWPGPSPLVRTGMLSIDRSVMEAPPQGVPTCSSADGRAPSDINKHDGVFDKCLNSMAFHRPYEPGSVSGQEYGRGKDYASSWSEQYYNCAIEMADFLRTQRGTLFVIGLGEPSDDFTDPYQDVSRTLERKDVFLSRVANDYTFAYRVPEHLHLAVHPDFDYSGYATYGDLQQKTFPREGLYLPTDNPKQLEEVFRKMAMRILLRLVR